jgi:hypothetical protein
MVGAGALNEDAAALDYEFIVKVVGVVRFCGSTSFFFLENGRGGEIRTPDPHNPIVVRYQAALRPDRAKKLEGGHDTGRPFPLKGS